MKDDIDFPRSYDYKDSHKLFIENALLNLLQKHFN